LLYTYDMKINKVIKTLTYSDIVFFSAIGFIGPIFAIFLTDQIKGGDIKVVGFAAAFYWIVKSILQIPIASYLDKRKGEKDDFYFMVIGLFLASIVPFGYILSSLPWHIYAFQCLMGVGMAMNLPAWCAIFTRHIDRGKEALEWSIRSTGLGIGTGIAGAIGGVAVATIGFERLFIIVGILGFIGASLLLAIRNNIYPRDHFKPKILPPEEKPPVR